MDRYGKDSFTQTGRYITETKLTKKERYGDENYVNIEKQRATNLEKFGSKSYMGTEEFMKKSKDTMKDLYGGEHPLQCPEIKEKWHKTCQKRYDAPSPLDSEVCRSMALETKMERYGNPNYNNREKFRDTCQERFGADNPFKSEELREKAKMTCLERSGVTHHMKDPETFDRIMASGLRVRRYPQDTGLTYQGTYELDFLDRYHGRFEILNGVPVEYEFGGGAHTYYPDFYVPVLNLVVEVKSSHWMKEHRSVNEAKATAVRSSGMLFLFIVDRDYSVMDVLAGVIR